MLFYFIITLYYLIYTARRRRPSNIRLTFKPHSRAKRGIGTCFCMRFHAKTVTKWFIRLKRLFDVFLILSILFFLPQYKVDIQTYQILLNSILYLICYYIDLHPNFALIILSIIFLLVLAQFLDQSRLL